MSKKEITLRPYQENIINETLAAVQFGSDNVVIDSPPASGKSIIISKTAQELSKQGNVVISITITALLDQIASHLDMIGQSYSILKAGRESEFNPDEKIQLVQAHTLHARISKSPITASYYLQDECFTPETEIFTENGFIRFDKLEVKTKVAQYNSDNDSISFTNPLRHIKNHTTDDLIHMYSDKGIDLITTKNHNMLIFNKQTNISSKKHAIDLEKSVNNLIKVSSLNTTTLNITDELSYDEKLELAFQADGSYHCMYDGRYKNSDKCSILFSFSKQRKLKEFTDTFVTANELKSQQKIVNRKEKRRFIIEDVYKNKLSKNLRDIFDITKFSTKKAIAFLDYLMIWDGHITKTGSYYYSSKIKDNVDFVQEVCIIAGKKTKLGIQVDNRSETFSDIYRIYISHANSFTTSKIETSLIKYNGYVYCVEVPDGNIIVRRNNKIAIVGNCHREYMTDRTRDILNFLKPKARIGYSGTCYDQAGFALEGAEMLQTTTVQDLQSQGYLCPIKYLIPKWSEQVDYSQVKSSGNDYNNVELEKIINSPEHLALVVKSMNEVDAKNKKTLVFCSSIEQADKVTDALVKAGYEAMSYHSKSDNSEEILDAFRNNTPFVKKPKKQKMKDLETGDLFADDMQFSSEPEIEEKYIKCLVSINRLGIGFDCPDVVLGVQLRPTLVRSLYIQQVMRLARKHESKQFSEYLDLAQTTSRFGFHDDDYVAPVRTGDKALDKKNMQEIDSKYALEDIAVVLQDTPVPIDRELYVAQIDAIKKSLKKNIEDMSFEELVKAYDLSKNHKEIITIATLVYTLKYGKPVSKAGYEYNYKPEQFWSESFFGKEEFHVLHDMQYYLDEFPHMQKQWIKSLKTRCRNIIRDELGLFRITGFIQFLRNKYVEEEMSEITSYSKKEDSSADEAVSYTKMNEMDFEIDDDEIPFSLSIAVPLASLSLYLEWCNMFI